MGMGLGCCGNTPPEYFVGLWTDGDAVRMRIWESGTLNYIKEANGGSVKMTISPTYDENGFSTSLLKGVYDGRRPNRPVFIVNNDRLTKQPIGNRGMLVTTSIV